MVRAEGRRVERGAVGVGSKKCTGLCTVWEGEKHGFGGYGRSG